MTLAQDLLLALNYTPSLSSVIKSSKCYIEKLNKFKKYFISFSIIPCMGTWNLHAYMFIYKENIRKYREGYETHP